jgi:hypothetical protein
MNSAQKCANKEQQETVANIAEHNTEKERESYNRKNCRIYFFMHRNAIGIHDFLEDICEIVGLDKGRWFD